MAKGEGGADTSPLAAGGGRCIDRRSIPASTDHRRIAASTDAASTDRRRVDRCRIDRPQLPKLDQIAI
jgi:hypothetical protein